MTLAPPPVVQKVHNINMFLNNNNILNFSQKEMEERSFDCTQLGSFKKEALRCRRL